MRYLLDSNVVIAIMKMRPYVLSELRRRRVEDCAISTVVLHELYFGAFNSERISANIADVDLLSFPTLDFTGEDARHAGRLRAALRRRGTPIGPYDILIAGQALARGLVLVTHNAAEFARVDGLTVEDWEVG